MAINIGKLKVVSRVYVPPMAGVTDLVFREVVRTIDPNCLLSTEMVSSKALMYKAENRIMDLAPDEHPIGIQLFGHEPDVMAQAAAMAEAKGADFVDINMGCPVPKITKGKDGCALMKEPDLAHDIVTAVINAVKIPVTVKFRLGWDDESRNAVDFGAMLESAGVSAVTVHGRTRQQLYSGKADWGFIALVKKALSIPVFGNGDVFEAEDAVRLLEATNCDGVAVARGTLGNPWLIPRITKLLDTGVLDDPPDEVDRLATAYRHAVGLIAYKGERVGANESRRHLTHYTKGILHSAPFRARLTQIKNAAEAAEILAELALQVGGNSGLARFLFDVENVNLHYGKQVSQRYSDSGSNFPTPVVLNTILPVTKPNYTTPEGNPYPAK